MVMSTKEQETFETALVNPGSLASIRAGLSKIDVRQVWILYPGLHGSSSAYATVGSQGPAELNFISDLQAECRNVEDKNQILLELEQGVGSDECNRLVVGLMRKELLAQAKAAQAAIAAAQAAELAAIAAAQAAAAARQLDNLNGLLDEM